ncbi:MAG: hypothetical protein ACI9MJ_001116 [Alphaproteobacteria bacterium]
MNRQDFIFRKFLGAPKERADRPQSEDRRGRADQVATGSGFPRVKCFETPNGIVTQRANARSWMWNGSDLRRTKQPLIAVISTGRRNTSVELPFLEEERPKLPQNRT